VKLLLRLRGSSGAPDERKLLVAVFLNPPSEYVSEETVPLETKNPEDSLTNPPSIESESESTAWWARGLNRVSVN